MGVKYSVVRTKPFVFLIESLGRAHGALETKDILWLEGRLANSPDTMGDHVSGLKGLNLPVFKARLKDSCCNLAAREGWRIYYAVSDATMRVYLLFVHHKKDVANPAREYLQQMIQKSFEDGV